MIQAQIIINGDSGIEIIFGDSIKEAINNKVQAFAEDFRQKALVGVLDIVPSYASVLINYDPLQITYKALLSAINNEIEVLKNDYLDAKCEILNIPVYYGGAYGVDIEAVARHNDLSVESLIKIHTAALYRVYMLGFKPGFPYLGGMSEQLEMPRLESPRVEIAAGSVGIAGKQTGIYPQNSPGGWRIIGHTPLKLIDWNQEQIALLRAGQYVRFYAVTYERYLELITLIERDEYDLEIQTCKEAEL